MEDGVDVLSRNVGNYQRTLRNNPEEWRSQSNRGGNQKSRILKTTCLKNSYLLRVTLNDKYPIYMLCTLSVIHRYCHIDSLVMLQTQPSPCTLHYFSFSCLRRVRQNNMFLMGISIKQTNVSTKGVHSRALHFRTDVQQSSETRTRR